MREPAGIRLTIYSKQSEEQDAQENGSESPLQVYTYGERLRLTAKLRLPRNYRNPGAMDLAGYLALQGIRLTGSARASNVEILPGFAGSRIGLWRSRARRSVLEQIAQSLARRERRTDAGCADRRSRVLRARDQIRLPAHRHVSHPRRLGDQRRHPRVRRLLAAADTSLRRDLGDRPDHRSVVGIRIRRRPGFAHRARHHHAEYLSAHAAAVSRSRRAECARHCRARNPAGQSARVIRSQLPADVSLGDRRRRNRRAHPAPHHLRAAKRPAQSRLA